MAEDGLHGWNPERVDSLRMNFVRGLEHHGVQSPESAIGIVVTALKNSLADDRGRWILGPHPDAQSEYRIRTRDRTYVIDRVFRDSDGTRWVVDYKTSRHEGANVESFLDREQERCAAQLDAYAIALRGSQKALYFPFHQGWRAWDA